MLNSRKIKILEAIVNDYIASAEPIGSRTIAKKYGLGISSATIRNEMSDLEEMGYIIASHASSGRAPSDKGYRLYVDEFMQKKRLKPEQKKLLINATTNKLNQIDLMLKDIAQAICHITNYTTIVADQPQSHKIKHIQIVPIDSATLALMLITDLKAIKNHIVFLQNSDEISFNTAAKISAELSRLLAGASINDLTELFIGLIKHRFNEINISHTIVRPLIEAIRALLQAADNIKIHTFGVKNILDFPEFSDAAKARVIVGILEEPEDLKKLLSNEGGQIKVLIGKENEDAMLKDCSIIKANMRISGHLSCNIAIIGPTRMDYSQVMSVFGTILEGMAEASGANSP